jgi:TonB family protein
MCPTAGVEFATGPKNINGTGIDYSETDFSFGVEAGVIATSATRQVVVVPTGSIAFASAHARFTGASGSVSNDLSFGIVRLGVGFVFGQEASVTPSVLRPVGLSGASTSFGVTVAFNFGGPQKMAITSRATSCAGLASTDSAVHDTAQVTERPTVRSAPEPAYPRIQRESGIEGRVIMAAIIGPDGTPEQGSVRIIQGVDPAIDREALRWIRGASYWPACHDGRPVRARVAQPLDFCRFPPCRRGTH